MPERQSFAAAVKAVEGGEQGYAAVRGLVREGARLLGAYGVASDEWPRLAAEAGYKGARWQDRRAQDAVVNAAFDALYDKYGDWRLVAVAWKAGERAADQIAQNPSLLNHPALAEVREYVTGVMSKAVEATRQYAPEGTPDPEYFSPNLANMKHPDTGLNASQTSVRTALTRTLYALRNRSRYQYEQSKQAETDTSRIKTGEVTSDI